MPKFGQIISMCALPAKVGHVALLVYQIVSDGPISRDEMLSLIKEESSVEVTREIVIPMGSLFEDVYGFTALKIFCSDPHPWPDRVDVLSIIYARKLYTQGLLWVCLADDSGNLFSFQSKEAIDAVSRWLIQSQIIWRDRYHSHTNPEEDQIRVISGESLGELIGRIKNAT